MATPLLWVALIVLAAPGAAAGAGTSVSELQAAVDRAAADLSAAEAALANAQASLEAAISAQEQPPPLQSPSVAARSPDCPDTLTMVDTFTINRTVWAACEDLSVPDGALALLSANGAAQWFSKSHEPYIQGDDEEYYLGLGKAKVLEAKTDILGETILRRCQAPNPGSNLCEPTWSGVERALPVIRKSGEHGVRTFVGSRGACVDATFSDKAEDKSLNGFPPVQSFVMNLTAVASGDPPIQDFTKYINWSYVADGLVGGVDPNVIFYFPVQPNTTYGAQGPGAKYWTMVASPVADMKGGREQSVWFRFQQISCHDAPKERSIYGVGPSCTLHGSPQYWDTYWYSRSPLGHWVPPHAVASASGFYENLLLTRLYWQRTMQNEGMAQLSLPSSKHCATNGTLLVTQAIHSIVRSMISREDTWHGRYGVLPGYGVSLQDGFQDTFTATVTGALEMGSMPYAKGVIDNWLRFYVQRNGGPTYRAEEVAVQSRMLTLLALYVSYADGEQEQLDADSFLLSHFDKAKALADWLLFRYNKSLEFPSSHPSYGIPSGDDEADTYIGYMYSNASIEALPHFYSAAAEMYRGFKEIGAVWSRIGKAAARMDVVTHANQLLSVAPKLFSALHRSLNMTTVTTQNSHARRCLPTVSDGALGVCAQPTSFRSYSEMVYSGALTYQQVDDIYTDLAQGNKSAPGAPCCRPMTLGCPGYNNKQTTYTAYGMAYGLLNADMVERFLLHFFGVSAHTYTRGTWTVPEAVHPDRDVGSTDYVAAGMMTVPTYLGWALKFEELESQTLWLGKAIPREWLKAGGQSVVANRLTTRYGRVSYVLSASFSPGSAYTVRANVTLPFRHTLRRPTGGLRLRLRVPVEHAGKMRSVTVGGVNWPEFNAALETVDFSAAKLSVNQILEGMHAIVATFA